MKKKLSLALHALLLVALSIPSVLAQNTTPNRRTPPNVAGPSGRQMRERPKLPSEATSAIEEDFSEALSIVQDNYVDGQKIDYNGAFKSSIIGMLRSLDPHSNYYDAKEFEELRNDWRSEYFGIGATIGDRKIKGSQDTYILSTFDKSPAARAGMHFGDKLVEVHGESIKGKPSSDVRDRLRGPRGSTVKVTVERAASGQNETVEIIRDAVSQPTVPDYYMVKPGVGYIDMTRGFNYDTAERFNDAIDELKGKGMTALVLDLRNNPGGLLDQAHKVAERFLQRGQLILSQRGRASGERTLISQNSAPDNIPLVVLVNRNSASASEIVAGALQDHDRALIIGETTFGKGLVQSIIPLEYGTALTLTSSKYYTPSGRLIQRDYSAEGLYDYYTRGGLGSQDVEEGAAAQPAKPNGPESRTDTGRVVYGGGGIAPDEAVKPRLLSVAQQRMNIDPVFAFVRELVNGRIAGFESYKLQRPIEFDHELKADEYPVTDNLFKAFKNFVADHSDDYKYTEAQLDKNRDHLARQIRSYISTATYGTVKAGRMQVFDDPQVTKAVEVLPRARELAAAAQRGRNPQQKSFE
ncbi:S41 family peptidase [soil metagenome]